MTQSKVQMPAILEVWNVVPLWLLCDRSCLQPNVKLEILKMFETKQVCRSWNWPWAGWPSSFWPEEPLPASWHILTLCCTNWSWNVFLYVFLTSTSESSPLVFLHFSWLRTCAISIQSNLLTWRQKTTNSMSRSILPLMIVQALWDAPLPPAEIQETKYQELKRNEELIWRKLGN